MPERIQLRRTKGWSMPPDTVKVDRSTKWGNPYRVIPGGWHRGDMEVVKTYFDGGGRPGQPDNEFQGRSIARVNGRRNATQKAVELYRELIKSPEGELMRRQIKGELRGRNLACWCKVGDPCHADVLLEIANAPEKET